MRTNRLLRFAQENGAGMTREELRLWVRLRRGQMGVRFRRQHPIGPYVVDFACLERRLVVEADGSQHIESEYDRVRDRYLAEEGWTVLRFGNHKIFEDIESVMGTIATVLEP